MDDSLCDAQLIDSVESRALRVILTRSKQAWAYGTEMNPLNLIRVIPAQGRDSEKSVYHCDNIGMRI
jgi:hypothetical protein